MFLGFNYWEPVINFVGTFLGAILAAAASFVVVNRQISYDKKKDKSNKLEQFVKETVEFRSYTIAIIRVFEELISSIDHSISNKQHSNVLASIEVIRKHEESHLIINKEYIPLEIFRNFIGVKLLVSGLISSFETYIDSGDLIAKEEIIRDFNSLKDAFGMLDSYVKEKEEEFKNIS